MVADTSTAESREPRAESREPDDGRRTTAFHQKIMRSGPATRTAFTSVNLASAVSALSAGFAFALCSASVDPASAANDAFALKVHSHRDHAQRCAVPPCETVSEEAATPWLPATLARFGNRSAIYWDRSPHAFRRYRSGLPFICRRTSLARSLAAQPSRLQ